MVGVAAGLRQVECRTFRDLLCEDFAPAVDRTVSTIGNGVSGSATTRYRGGLNGLNALPSTHG